MKNATIISVLAIVTCAVMRKKARMTMKGMATLEKRGIKILITHLPNRKNPCLAVQIDNCITKVASFNSEVEADWFIEILEEMFIESEVQDGKML